MMVRMSGRHLTLFVMLLSFSFLKREWNSLTKISYSLHSDVPKLWKHICGLNLCTQIFSGYHRPIFSYLAIWPHIKSLWCSSTKDAAYELTSSDPLCHATIIFFPEFYFGSKYGRLNRMYRTLDLCSYLLTERHIFTLYRI